MKEFKTIDEQVQLLCQRGLVITDIENVKRYLLTQNYYNIINGYARYFPRNGEYYTGKTNFNEIANLYIFEREIKQAIFQAIIAMETHVKAIFTYRYAEAYPHTPYAYLNIECYDAKKTLSVISTISKLARTIFTPETMLSFIENINDVRNICAHNNRLLGYTCRRDSKYLPVLHKPYGITANTNRRSVFSVLISLQCFLSHREYDALQHTIKKQIQHLDAQLETVSIHTILDKLGFPSEWQYI